MSGYKSHCTNQQWLTIFLTLVQSAAVDMFKLVVLQLAIVLAVVTAQQKSGPPMPMPMPMPGPGQMPNPMPSKIMRVAREASNPPEMPNPGDGNGQRNNRMGSIPGVDVMTNMMQAGQDMARKVGDQMMSGMGGRRRRNI